MIKSQEALAGLGDDEALRLLQLTYSLYRVLGTTTAYGSYHMPSASQVPYLQLCDHKTLWVCKSIYIDHWVSVNSHQIENEEGTNHCAQWHLMA